MRDFDQFDRLIMGLDDALKTAFRVTAAPDRPYPAEGLDAEALTERDRRHAAGLMRVDHAGEVAAQALYRGQEWIGRSESVRAAMRRAAAEENDHLAWCERRLAELDARPSLLGPVWYLGSFCIGSCAGLFGDRWSLGFVAETERQVVRHLESHLRGLPEEDRRSRAVLEQMRDDEGRHATAAIESGGEKLPEAVKMLMALASRVMTTTAYWV
ncbi:MAG: 2-polyprenyl-3-methyl-6-methoxy-1,4-benzoquinone monooxygenase [Gammaproteobacteria bacterium]|nr:2-polyprenyl-3-methyl-6-methoxy-1,4-benzoquinone monooxygenase [Gammaproteobacteria bacterium]